MSRVLIAPPAQADLVMITSFIGVDLHSPIAASCTEVRTTLFYSQKANAKG